MQRYAVIVRPLRIMRLKRLIFGCALAAAGASLSAQDFDQLVVARGPVTEVQRDSVSVWLRNVGIRALNLTGAWSCPQWGDTLLSIRPEQTQLAVNDSTRVWLRFTPEHNLYYRLPVVLSTDEGRTWPQRRARR